MLKHGGPRTDSKHVASDAVAKDGGGGVILISSSMNVTNHGVLSSVRSIVLSQNEKKRRHEKGDTLILICNIFFTELDSNTTLKRTTRSRRYIKVIVRCIDIIYIQN